LGLVVLLFRRKATLDAEAWSDMAEAGTEGPSHQG
jgi:hypothetical protein